jgi:hypothetical protein
MKVVRLSALRTVRLYLPENIPGTHSCQRLSQPQGHTAAGRITSMKNSNVTIGNRTHNLPACQCLKQMSHRMPPINQSPWRKPVSAPLCPPQIPHRRAWDRTWAITVRQQQITACAMPPHPQHQETVLNFLHLRLFSTYFNATETDAYKH